MNLRAKLTIGGMVTMLAVSLIRPVQAQEKKAEEKKAEPAKAKAEKVTGDIGLLEELHDRGNQRRKTDHARF